MAWQHFTRPLRECFEICDVLMFVIRYMYK